MHRDPARVKCQAVPFGSHRDFLLWPDWVSVKSSIKIVGGFLSNSESLEKINSDHVQKFLCISQSLGYKGNYFSESSLC